MRQTGGGNRLRYGDSGLHRLYPKDERDLSGRNRETGDSAPHSPGPGGHGAFVRAKNMLGGAQPAPRHLWPEQEGICTVLRQDCRNQDREEPSIPECTGRKLYI